MKLHLRFKLGHILVAAVGVAVLTVFESAFYLQGAIPNHNEMAAESNNIVFADQPLMECLLTEEAFIHSLGVSTPIYALNQGIINLLASYSYLTMQEKFLRQTCVNTGTSPSLNFLAVMLAHQGMIFEEDGAKFGIDSHQRKVLTKIFYEEAQEIILAFLINLRMHFYQEQCCYRGRVLLEELIQGHGQLSDDLNNFFLKYQTTLQQLFDYLKKLDHYRNSKHPAPTANQK